MTTCPFCGHDPFHRTDSGEAVAVTCCELGDLYFRGARPALTSEVSMDPDEFMNIGAKILEMQYELTNYRERFGELSDQQQ